MKLLKKHRETQRDRSSYHDVGNPSTVHRDDSFDCIEHCDKIQETIDGAEVSGVVQSGSYGNLEVEVEAGSCNRVGGNRTEDMSMVHNVLKVRRVGCLSSMYSFLARHVH